MKFSVFQILKLLELALTQCFSSLLRCSDFSVVILNQHYVCMYFQIDLFYNWSEFYLQTTKCMCIAWVTGNQKSVWFQLCWFELVPGVLFSKADFTADTHS